MFSFASVAEKNMTLWAEHKKNFKNFTLRKKSNEWWMLFIGEKNFVFLSSLHLFVFARQKTNCTRNGWRLKRYRNHFNLDGCGTLNLGKKQKSKFRNKSEKVSTSTPNKPQVKLHLSTLPIHYSFISLHHALFHSKPISFSFKFVFRSPDFIAQLSKQEVRESFQLRWSHPRVYHVWESNNIKCNKFYIQRKLLKRAKTAFVSIKDVDKLIQIVFDLYWTFYFVWISKTNSKL